MYWLKLSYLIQPDKHLQTVNNYKMSQLSYIVLFSRNQSRHQQDPTKRNEYHSANGTE